jgi:hypothetical protein
MVKIEWLIPIYVFATICDIPRLRRDIFPKIPCCVNENQVLELSWGSESVAELYEEMPVNDPLRRLLVDSICCDADDMFLEVDRTPTWPVQLRSTVLRGYVQVSEDYNFDMNCA